MHSIKRRIVNTSALVLAAATLACGRTDVSAPDNGAPKQGSQTTPTSAGQTRPDGAGLTVTPGALALRVGDKGGLTAALVNASGAVLEVPTQELPWTSSNTAVATVTGTGAVTAIGAGEATISTTVGAFSGSARVIVTR